MKIDKTTHGIAQLRSSMLVPANGWVMGELRPQARQYAAVAPLFEDTSVTVDTGTVLGHRTWSPPIT